MNRRRIFIYIALFGALVGSFLIHGWGLVNSAASSLNSSSGCEVVVRTNGLNLNGHTRPELEAYIPGSIPNGTRVEATRAQNGWVLIEYSWLDARYTHAWVWGELVEGDCKYDLPIG